MSSTFHRVAVMSTVAVSFTGIWQVGRWSGGVLRWSQTGPGHVVFFQSAFIISRHLLQALDPVRLQDESRETHTHVRPLRVDTLMMTQLPGIHTALIHILQTLHLLHHVLRVLHLFQRKRLLLSTFRNSPGWAGGSGVCPLPDCAVIGHARPLTAGQEGVATGFTQSLWRVT